MHRCCCCCHQVERALLDLCLDPSDSYLAAVAVDMGTSLAEGSVSSSVRLYEVSWSCACCVGCRVGQDIFLWMNSFGLKHSSLWASVCHW